MLYPFGHNTQSQLSLHMLEIAQPGMEVLRPANCITLTQRRTYHILLLAFFP